MRKKITQSGRVDKKGKLKMFMGEINQFLSRNIGKTIIATFEVYEPNTSEALKGYYRNYILPTMQKALYETGERMSLQGVEEYLLNLSPVVSVEGYEELSQSEFTDYIDWIKQFAAENLSVYIEDPNEL